MRDINHTQQDLREKLVNRKSRKLQNSENRKILCWLLLLSYLKFFSRAIFVNNLHIPLHLTLHSIQHDLTTRQRPQKTSLTKLCWWRTQSNFLCPLVEVRAFVIKRHQNLMKVLNVFFTINNIDDSLHVSYVYV